jgi:hypothetical protein
MVSVSNIDLLKKINTKPLSPKGEIAPGVRGCAKNPVRKFADQKVLQ